MATWTKDIIKGLGRISGTGTLTEIYAAVSPLRPNLPDSWRDIIRRNIQDHSSDSAGFRGGDDLFFSDTSENIIVLCPNHHALCDYGAIRLEVSAITHRTGHRIAQSSLDYHNTSIYGARF